MRQLPLASGPICAAPRHEWLPLPRSPQTARSKDSVDSIHAPQAMLSPYAARVRHLCPRNQLALARRPLIQSGSPFCAIAEREPNDHSAVLLYWRGGMTGVWVSAAVLFALVVVILMVAMRS